MPRRSDQAYLLHRADVSRQAMNAATDASARVAHAALARAYDARLRAITPNAETADSDSEQLAVWANEGGIPA